MIYFRVESSICITLDAYIFFLQNCKNLEQVYTYTIKKIYKCAQKMTD